MTGEQQIHEMWDMACSVNKAGVTSDIVAIVQELSANESTGLVVVIDDYRFRDNGRKVHKKIVAKVKFRNGKIVKQTDDSDPILWAKQAFGGFNGFIAGHVELIRRWKAMKKLKEERPQAFQVSENVVPARILDTAVERSTGLS